MAVHKSVLLEKQLETLHKLEKTLAKKSVEAGWFETARYQAYERAGKTVNTASIGQPVAKIARIQEFGATIRTKNAIIVIPARPFMRKAWKSISDKRKEIQFYLARQLLNGKISPDEALGQIGLMMEGEIVTSIRDGGWQKNAPSTIKKKGFDKPLIDSAQMWQSVSSAVVDATAD